MNADFGNRPNVVVVGPNGLPVEGASPDEDAEQPGSVQPHHLASVIVWEVLQAFQLYQFPRPHDGGSKIDTNDVDIVCKLGYAGDGASPSCDGYMPVPAQNPFGDFAFGGGVSGD